MAEVQVVPVQHEDEEVWVRQQPQKPLNTVKTFSKRPLTKPVQLEFENLTYTVPLGLNRGKFFLYI